MKKDKRSLVSGQQGHWSLQPVQGRGPPQWCHTDILLQTKRNTSLPKPTSSPPQSLKPCKKDEYQISDFHHGFS